MKDSECPRLETWQNYSGVVVFLGLFAVQIVGENGEMMVFSK